eukprot:CAMPEP_0113456078 /NCGR_PEP_ID=MMETSP0014_2-20120614/8701_1 /TAXON_ID=2857 /ORGANISM="Nitzschia sp." /LENGTH=586 /DNA_ID=CAMNT_0000347519 /DNA_START=210 /DNA_END=1967 /DNA_ORIENTATION=+ /assembly_acc=CAM_ASM_000159
MMKSSSSPVWWTFIRLTDRRLIQILVFVAAIFSFTSTTFIHLADLEEEQQQQQHDQKYIGQQKAQHRSKPSSSSSTTTTTTTKAPNKVEVNNEQGLGQRRKNRHQHLQASLADWLLEDPYHHHHTIIQEEENILLSKDDAHEEEEDPIEQYGTIFCPRRRGQQQQQQQHNRRRKRPVILWGIPSTTSPSETIRRQVLRSTYLNYYRLLLLQPLPPPLGEQQQQNYNPIIDQNLTVRAAGRNEITKIDKNQIRNRICSFHEWTCNHTAVVEDCQIIYVFFVGAGDPKSVPSELVGLEDEDEDEDDDDASKTTDFRSMLYTGDHVPQFNNNNNNNSSYSSSTNNNNRHHLIPIDKYEPGVVYLNIRENQFDGKMTTWFQFASLVEKEFRDEIDYVAKVDSDLLLFTPNFMEWIETEHRRLHGEQHSPPRQTYGGIEFPSTNCELNATYDHDCPLPLVGRSYMSGELNFMSVDLARYIVSKHCPRNTLTIPHEDVSLSNYVYSYKNNTSTTYRRHRLSTADHTSNHTIKIMSVEDKDIMLTKSATADWRKLDLETTERFLDIVWGHSIKRGRYQQYLVFKRDNSFVTTW